MRPQSTLTPITFTEWPNGYVDRTFSPVAEDEEEPDEDDEDEDDEEDDGEPA